MYRVTSVDFRFGFNTSKQVPNPLLGFTRLSPSLSLNFSPKQL